MLLDCPEAAGADRSSPKAPVYRAAPIREALIDCAKALLPETGLPQVNGMTEVAISVMPLTCSSAVSGSSAFAQSISASRIGAAR